MNSNSSTIKKVIINGAAFILILMLTFYIVFRQISFSEIMSAISLVKFRYIVAGLLAMAVFTIGEGLNIGRPLNMFGDQVSVLQSLKYAIIGFFFSSITPSSSGGQPMQLYFIHGDDIKVSHGTLALLFELLSFEIIATVFSVTGYITQHNLFVAAMGRGRYFLLIGIGISVLVVCFLMLAIFSKKAIVSVCNICIRIVKIFSREKSESLSIKADLMIHEYRNSARYFKENKIIFVKSLITTAVQLTAMFSIPYFVYLGFGLSGYSAFQIIMMQAVLFVAVAFLPLPGAVGASEGAFVLMFNIVFPKDILAGAMVLCRCLSFYICVIITGIAVCYFIHRLLRKKSKRA